MGEKPFCLKEASAFLGWNPPETYQNGPDQWEKIRSRVEQPALEIHFRSKDRLLMVTLIDEEGRMVPPAIGIMEPQRILLDRSVRVEVGQIHSQKTVKFSGREDWLQVSSDSHGNFFSSPPSVIGTGPKTTQSH